MKDYPPSQTPGSFNLEGFRSKSKVAPAETNRRAGRFVPRVLLLCYLRDFLSFLVGRPTNRL